MPSDVKQISEQSKKRLAKGQSLGGVPSTYRPEYCEQMVQFFSRPLTRVFMKKEIIKADGETIREYEEKGTQLPFFTEFAHSIGVTTSCLNKWKDKYEQFGTAYNKCKELQLNHLVQNALIFNYNAPFAIFTMKNITDWRDQTDIKHTGNIDLNAKSILTAIEDAEVKAVNKTAERLSAPSVN